MTTLSQRFADAILYAFQLHRHQVRKGTTVPYMAHLLGVAAIALEHGTDEDEAIAALLHDAMVTITKLAPILKCTPLHRAI